jgi:hypothetical protein
MRKSIKYYVFMLTNGQKAVCKARDEDEARAALAPLTHKHIYATLERVTRDQDIALNGDFNPITGKYQLAKRVNEKE